MTSAASSTWAKEIGADINASNSLVSISSLSCLPPRHQKPDAFGQLWASIQGAARRGCAVFFFLPEPTRSHPATMRNAFARDVLIALGVKAFLLPSMKLLHAKTVMIDNKIAWAGSGNWTAAASNHNHEFYIRTTDPLAVSALAGFHLELDRLANENFRPGHPA